jgi:hypothetical protein
LRSSRRRASGAASIVLERLRLATSRAKILKYADPIAWCAICIRVYRMSKPWSVFEKVGID